ncbi:hypothetical protein HG531_008683 [Fusarium graminearum]|nr:hypothetical protein HG531_008683 [Fusarium graminearum]
MVQDTTRLSLDLDIVADILPMENRSLLLHIRNLLGGFIAACELSTTSTSCFLVTLALSSVFLHLLAREHENFALGTFRGDGLGSDQVQTHKQNRESNDNCKVAPLVGVEVPACENREMSEYSGPLGTKLEQGIACIKGNDKEHNGCTSERRGDGLGEGCDESKKHGEIQRRHERYQKEEEVVSSVPAKVAHKVHGRVHHDGIEDLVWQINQHGRKSLCTRMVQSITGVLLDNVALGVECHNLQDVVVGVHQKNKEDK